MHSYFRNIARAGITLAVISMIPLVGPSIGLSRAEAIIIVLIALVLFRDELDWRKSPPPRRRPLP